MKVWCLLLLCLVVTAVVAKKKDRSRNKRVDRQKADRPGKVAKIDQVDDDDDDDETAAVTAQEDGEQQAGRTHPCNSMKCSRGEMCHLEEDESPVCKCQTCLETDDADLKVCSTDNDTYSTECELDREHCLCKKRLDGCSNDRLKRVRLDYYSPCKKLSKCPEFEMNQFPQRMRDWLFRVMRDLANRQELDEYLDLLEAATNDDTHADAVIWKFCDLDMQPHDRRVTRRELMYIIASIKPMEHCLVPFLNNCDADDSNSISMLEWADCLGIGHDVIEDKCRVVHERRG